MEIIVTEGQGPNMTEAEIEARLEEIEPRLAEAKRELHRANLAHHQGNVAWQQAAAAQNAREYKRDRVRAGNIVVPGQERAAMRAARTAEGEVRAGAVEVGDALAELEAARDEVNRLGRRVRALSKERDYLKHIALSDARKRAERLARTAERRQTESPAARLSGVFDLVRRSGR